MITTIDTYKAALAAHDWWYAHSDDYSAYRSGQEEREALLLAQRRLDPRGEIWNQFAPRDFRIAK